MKIIKFVPSIALSFLALVSTTSFAAGPAATIEQVAWMTGNWAGQLGA